MILAEELAVVASRARDDHVADCFFSSSYSILLVRVSVPSGTGREASLCLARGVGGYDPKDKVAHQ